MGTGEFLNAKLNTRDKRGTVLFGQICERISAKEGRKKFQLNEILTAKDRYKTRIRRQSNFEKK